MCTTNQKPYYVYKEFFSYSSSTTRGAKAPSVRTDAQMPSCTAAQKQSSTDAQQCSDTATQKPSNPEAQLHSSLVD